MAWFVLAWGILLELAICSRLVETYGITQSATPQPEYLRLRPDGIARCCSLDIGSDPNRGLNEGEIGGYDLSTGWSELIQCVNSSAIAHMNRVLSDRESPARIGFVTFATRSIWDYTAYSFAINQIYAEHHGYVFRHLDEGSEGSAAYDPRDSRWNKVKILEQAVSEYPADELEDEGEGEGEVEVEAEAESGTGASWKTPRQGKQERDREKETGWGWGSGLDYVVWVDADVAVLDMGLRIEDVVSQHPEAHLFSSAEHAGSTTLINSGTVIMRVSEFSKMFLRAWWDFGERTLFSDQEQFDMLYKFCEDRWAAWSRGGEEAHGEFVRSHVQRMHPPGQGRRGGSGGGSGSGSGSGSASLAALEALLAYPPFDIRRKVVILPPDALNSDPPAMSQQRPHNQVLHLMGEHSSYRRAVFGAGLGELCRFLNQQNQQQNQQQQPPPQPQPLQQQLGLHQQNLLRWTLRVYGREAALLLAEYAAGAAGGQYTYSVPESRRLANAVHHYAHALVTSEQRSDSHVDVKGEEEEEGEELALNLRWKVWKLLSQNIDARRARAAAAAAKEEEGISLESSESRGAQAKGPSPSPSGRVSASSSSSSSSSRTVSADWPELLKVTAEAGQQLVSLVRLPLSTRQGVAQSVAALLQEILRVCHAAQRPAVMHMVAHMHAERGMMSLQQERASDALGHFHESLQLYRSLSETSGTHILVQPLAALANVLCTLKHFSRAFPLFEHAIAIAEAVLGPRHESLANLYLNFGISKVEAGSSAEATLLLRRAVHLLDINTDLSSPSPSPTHAFTEVSGAAAADGRSSGSSLDHGDGNGDTHKHARQRAMKYLALAADLGG